MDPEIERHLEYLAEDKKRAIEIGSNLNADGVEVQNLFLRFAAHLEFILQRMK